MCVSPTVMYDLHFATPQNDHRALRVGRDPTVPPCESLSPNAPGAPRAQQEPFGSLSCFPVWKQTQTNHCYQQRSADLAGLLMLLLRFLSNVQLLLQSLFKVESQGQQ